MKKILLLSSAAILLASGAGAAEVRPYVSAKMNYNMIQNDVNGSGLYAEYNEIGVFTIDSNMDDDVLGGSLAFGAKFNMFRTEIEANMHQEAESLGDTLKNNSLMWNSYVDIDTGTRFTPYIGAGIGVARLKASSTDLNVDKTKTNFAWQIGAGTAFDLTKNLALDFGYRYVDNGSLTMPVELESSTSYYAGKVKIDSKSNEVYLGLRYTF